MAESITIKQLLEAGAHFGHQTSHWHPRMKSYIFTQRNGIHIIDLEQTLTKLNEAATFVKELISSGQSLLFVGTKKQGQAAIEEEAKRCGAYYVNQRWLGGMLTNFATIQSRIDYLVQLEDKKNRGDLDYMIKKERMKVDKEIAHLNRQMGGFKEMVNLPGALFVIDPNKEKIALAEAKKVDVPVIAIIDTNCDPSDIDYPIPANDDAIKTIKLVCSKIADAVLEAKELEETAEAGDIESTSIETAPSGLLESHTFTPEEG